MLEDLIGKMVIGEYRERLPAIDFQYYEEKERRMVRLVKVEGVHLWGMEEGKRGGHTLVRFNREGVKNVWFGVFDSDALKRVLTPGGKSV